MTIQEGYLSETERSTHTYVVGQPGTGKSRALQSWALQDILAGSGCAVIDPHGDLFHNMVNHLAFHPSVWERTIIIDPSNPSWVVGINPLENEPGTGPERTAQFLTDILVKIWGLDVTHAPRLIWLMNNCFLALMEADLNLLELPRFLVDKDFRANVIRRVQNPMVQRYFSQEYPTSQAAVHQWATPLLNKIGPFLFDEDIRLSLGARPALNFRLVMEDAMVLLINLSKGTLGEGASAMLGAFIVARLQKAALSRAGQSVRRPYYLYLDEFQNYTTDNIIDILAESRKYALSLTLAHQYLEQLQPAIQKAAINTAGTLINFRVSHRDAITLSQEMFLDRNQNEHSIKAKLGVNGVWPTISPVRIASEGKSNQLAISLTHLQPRDFWLKRRGSRRPTRHRTFDMPDVRGSQELRRRRSEFIATSGRLFGQSKQQLRQQVQEDQTIHRPKAPGFWSA